MPLMREALARLSEDAPPEETTTDDEGRLERGISLAEQRIGAILSVLRAADAHSVLDLGCGSGKLLAALWKDAAFQKVAGSDVSIGALEAAERRLHVDQMSGRQLERLTLFQSALTYRDRRFEGYDAAVLMEVIEHLDPERLPALQHALFGTARPRSVLVTTPNVEYNVRFETLPPGSMRHRDHRFEWTRGEFEAWGARVAADNDYRVRYLPVGTLDPEVGAPTQMAVFER
jgi:3' terminal RNA ribose 2'-O-methyltransferase Hen1